MKKLFRLLGWIDNHLIQILLSGFIFLAPLFPKLPIRMISYTYIAFRFEDVYAAILLFFYLIQILRKKVTINKTFLVLFVLFWIAAFLSFINGHYFLKTIQIWHIGFLHALRRVEYMSMFLITLSVIKNKKDFFWYLSLHLMVLFIVLVYGVGQKFLGWPAVQTMNPEYAKGYILFLTPDARISSTFSGHYDLAAYLVLFMPIVTAYYFFKKNIYYFGLLIFSIFILILTSSRISYGGFIISVFPFLLFMRKPKHFIIILIITLIFTFSSKSLTSRFKRTFQVKQIFVNQNTGQVVVPQKITTKEVPAGSFYFGRVNEYIKPDEKLLNQKLMEDAQTDARGKGRILTQTELDLLAASMAANLKPINTVVSDISFATRLQVEWPRAIKAFLKQPILGSGPSSITEATDNDYLRTLGEFGLLGSSLFAIILFTIAKKIFILIKNLNKNEQCMYYGFLFGLMGLLFNAGYIDVFEASKVAYFFWMMAGLFVGSITINTSRKNNA